MCKCNCMSPTWPDDYFSCCPCANWHNGVVFFPYCHNPCADCRPSFDTCLCMRFVATCCHDCKLAHPMSMHVHVLPWLTLHPCKSLCRNKMPGHAMLRCMRQCCSLAPQPEAQDLVWWACRCKGWHSCGHNAQASCWSWWVAPQTVQCTPAIIGWGLHTAAGVTHQQSCAAGRWPLPYAYARLQAAAWAVNRLYTHPCCQADACTYGSMDPAHRHNSAQAGTHVHKYALCVLLTNRQRSQALTAVP